MEPQSVCKTDVSGYVGSIPTCSMISGESFITLHAIFNWTGIGEVLGV